jgi:outer membrane protein
MKKSLILLAVVATLVPSLAMAEQGDIVVRLRATDVSPDTSSKLGSTTASSGITGSLADAIGPNSALEVDSNIIPEIDFSYYITKNIAAELILATGTRHDVKAVNTVVSPNAAVGLGSVNLLPPTLTLQWHFNPDQTIDPYVGAGVTYVRAMDRGLNLLGTYPIQIERNTWGAALQAGVDYNIADTKWLINADIKKIWVGTDVKLDDGVHGYKKIDSLDIDPWVVSVGVGRRF